MVEMELAAAAVEAPITADATPTETTPAVAPGGSPEGPPEASQEPAKASPEKEPKEERLAKQFAELSRKEYQLRNQEKSLKEKVSKAERYQKEKEAFNTDPIAFLEQQGWDYEKITKWYLNNKIGQPEQEAHQNPEARRLEERLAQLEKAEQERLAELKTQGERQQNDYWTTHLNAVSKYVQEQSDSYEVINSHPIRATEIYKDLLTQTLEYVGGRNLTDEEVITILNRTEDVITEETRPLVEKLIKTKKFGSLGTPRTEPDNKKIAIADPKMKTLTNDMASSMLGNAQAEKPKTDAERLALIKKKYG
jgi:hypothetical protein